MTLVWFLISVAGGYLLQPYAVKACQRRPRFQVSADERGITVSTHHPVRAAIAAGMEATYRNAQHIPLPAGATVTHNWVEQGFVSPGEYRAFWEMNDRALPARTVAIHKWGESEPIRRDLVGERRHPMTGDVIQTWQETRRGITGYG